jgi:hypothetical protein
VNPGRRITPATEGTEETEQGRSRAPEEEGERTDIWTDLRFQRKIGA